MFVAATFQSGKFSSQTFSKVLKKIGSQESWPVRSICDKKGTFQEYFLSIFVVGTQDAKRKGFDKN